MSGGMALHIASARFTSMFHPKQIVGFVPWQDVRDGWWSQPVAMRQGGGSDEVILGEGSPVPTIVFHGDRDITVHPNNGDQILEQSVRTTSTQKNVHRGRVPGGHAYTRTIHTDASGRGIFEHWNIHGAGHAWSGGSSAGSYTDPRGPDATREMLRFFLEHSLPQQSG